VAGLTAFLFPGQGSQKVGMGRELAENFLLAKQIFAAADDALGFSLSKLCFEGPEGELLRTQHAQPAILTTSIAAMRVYEKEFGVNPQVAAGHSLGEYSALVCASALALQDAVRVVHLRGRFMQEATPEGVGAMAAVVGLDARTVADTCQEAAGNEVCAPANFNGGGQTVIAGHRTAVERAMALAKQKGAKLVKALAVSAPFHCALMQPAAERLREALEPIRVKTPHIPVVHNVTAEPNVDVDVIKRLLCEQVTAPVRWEECVRTLKVMGTDRAFEFGAGTVLAGLGKRIEPTIAITSVGELKDVQP
jgi:[acyl-carrier-protein] S-malonyltransferase